LKDPKSLFFNLNNMKKLLLSLFIVTSSYSQVLVDHNATSLNDVPGGWTLGNSCDIPYFTDVFVIGDLELKDDCFIWNAKLTVYGDIIYNNHSITLACDNSELIVGATLSNFSHLKKKTILVYPNPTKGELHINTSEKYKVRIYDFAGRLISNKLNLSGRSSGLYIVEIIIDNKEYFKKVIKN